MMKAEEVEHVKRACEAVLAALHELREVHDILMTAPTACSLLTDVATMIHSETVLRSKGS